MTLLQIAKKAKLRHAIGRPMKWPMKELIDLAVSWAEGKISLAQTRAALRPGKRPGGADAWPLAVGLREAVKRGQLVKK